MNKMRSLILISLLFFSCEEKGPTLQNPSLSYTCSMHPHVREDETGICPICQMNLVPLQNNTMPITHKQRWQCQHFPDVVSEQEDICPLDGTKMVKITIHESIQLTASQRRHFKATTFLATKEQLTKSIRLLGVVLQSEDQESAIPARVAGRIEKVFIESTGSLVRKDDPIVEIYAPNLITAGEEYLLARESYQRVRSKEFQEMLSQSREKLELWGVQKDQYESWYQSKAVPRSMALHSPSTGIVRKRHAVVGKYFKEGQNLFELSNLSHVWVQMDVYEQDANLVSLGQKVSLKFIAIPGEIFSGEIDFIDPVLNARSRTLKVRTTLSNPTGQLRPGMASDVTLNITLKRPSLIVPRSAVIDTGKRKIVWLKVAEDTFEARSVHTGYESRNSVEIKQGILEGDAVVVEGHFLLDAQAEIFSGHR